MQAAVSPMAVEELVGRLVDSMEHGDTLEALVRPLLELLEAVTGLESTYLTAIDQEAGLQSVVYARNTLRLSVAEGLTVPWEDTLCRRALDERINYTDDVSGRWGDSAAARELGVATYASVPVHTVGGKLFGTLCAASDERKSQRADTITVMNLYSYGSGHLMVAPVRHAAAFDDLDDDVNTAIARAQVRALRAIRAVYSPDGANTGANLGRAAGAGVPGHLHVHVLPRWAGDTNFMTSIGEARVLPESLRTGYDKLKAAWPG